MQHNEDFCVADGSGSRLQDVDINKHMHRADIIAIDSTEFKSFVVVTGFFSTCKSQHEQTH